MQKIKKTTQQGFTLVEVLVVVGILAILLAITLVAINPNKHFQDSRDSQRSSNVGAILDAIYEYEAGNNGSVPPSVSGVTSAVPISKMASVSASNTAFSTPNLTFTVPSGNTITSGSVTVASCTSAGNNGTFTVTGGSGTTIIVTNAAGVAADATCVITSWSGRVDLCADLVPTYLADLPMDPSASAPTGGSTPCDAGTTAYNSGYTIAKAAANRFTIAAPNAEGAAAISVTR